MSNRWRSCISFAAAMVAAAGCSEGIEKAPTTAQVGGIRGMVTPAVAAQLTQDGAFANITASDLRGLHTITPEQAAELAVAHMREVGPQIREHVEGIHGAPVDFTQLTAEPGIILAESPSTDLPESAGAAARRHFGDYYLVTLRSANRQVVRLAVSAYASHFQVTPTGGPGLGDGGNDFRTWVISQSGEGQPQLSAEAVVQHAFKSFRRRIAAAPHFVRQGVDYAPQLGNWRVQFEAPVTVSRPSDNKRIEASVLYLDRLGNFGIPVGEQRGARFRLRSTGAQAAKDLAIPARPNMATAFTTVVPR